MKKILVLLLFVSTFANAQRHEIDSLLTALRKFERMPPSIHQDTLRAKPIKYLMYYYTFVNKDSALYFTQQLLDISQKRKITKNIVYCYNYFGYLYNQEGNYFLSANNYYQALILAEKIKDHVQIISCKRLLSESYYKLEDYQKAMKYCEEALVLATNQKDSNESLSCLNILGNIYLKQNRLEKAKITFQMMNEKATKVQDESYISESIRSLGMVEFVLKNYEKALHFLKQALSFHQKETYRYANIEVEIAKVLVAQKQFSAAIPLLISAQNTAKRAGGLSLLPILNQLLYESFKSQGKVGEALKYHENFMLLKDSLAKESIQRRIGSLQLDYDNKQKESQLQRNKIELLEEKTQKQQISQTRNLFLLGGILAVLLAGVLFWNNQKLTQKNIKIESQQTQIMLAQEQLENANQNLEFRVNERTSELAFANQNLIQKNEEIKTALFTGQSIERKRVASELHDNLSSLLSAVNMSIQTINTSSLSEHEQKIYGSLREMIKNAYHEVRNISHNIMPAGLEKDGLIGTLQSLIEKINLNRKLTFELFTSGLEKRLPLQIELNMYSVLLELINNIIKHSEATAASIELRSESDFFMLNITDNGIGFEKSTNNGNGLGNIKTRIEALNGSFGYSSEPKKGCSIKIKIPLS